MRILIFILTATLSLFAIDPLVSAKWLNENIKDPKISVVEVSSPDVYAKGHIPTAMSTTIEAWRYDNGTFLSVRAQNEIEKEISRLGIAMDSSVVLYAPISNPKDLLKASYVYWALVYHGVKNVALLDGGLESWKKNGFTLSQDLSTRQATEFKAQIDTSKIANREYVLSKIGKIPMIDARPGDLYLGVNPTPTVKRSGHIPGAMSYFWNYSVDGNYIMKPKESLREIFEKGYKLNPIKETLVYCTGGLETSFNFFVLHGVLGHKNTRLYDASMKEWGNKEETPINKHFYENFKQK
jgi:thiosulfate/3-mercaptopyruvate sulfurtransferase